MDQQVTLREADFVEDGGTGDAVLLRETDGTALDARLGEVWIAQGHNVVADTVAVGVVGHGGAGGRDRGG